MNPFARLKNLIAPEPPVVVARVIEHNEARDTSILDLLTGQATVAFADGVQTGTRFEARGRIVDVGQNAFVRNGVIESQAPLFDEIPEIVIGRIV